MIAAVHIDDVAEFGPLNAIVLTQIRHWQQFEDDGWFKATADKLAEKTGLSPDQCRRAVRYLIDEGAIEKSQPRAKHGDQTCHYRAVKRLVLAVGDSANSGSGDSANSGSGDSANSSSVLDIRKPPPTPPNGDIKASTAKSGQGGKDKRNAAGWTDEQIQAAREYVRTTPNINHPDKYLRALLQSDPNSQPFIADLRRPSVALYQVSDSEPDFTAALDGVRAVKAALSA